MTGCGRNFVSALIRPTKKIKHQLGEWYYNTYADVIYSLQLYHQFMNPWYRKNLLCLAEALNYFPHPQIIEVLRNSRIHCGTYYTLLLWWPLEWIYDHIPAQYSSCMALLGPDFYFYYLKVTPPPPHPPPIFTDVLVVNAGKGKAILSAQLRDTGKTALASRNGYLSGLALRVS